MLATVYCAPPRIWTPEDGKADSFEGVKKALSGNNLDNKHKDLIGKIKEYQRRDFLEKIKKLL